MASWYVAAALLPLVAGVATLFTLAARGGCQGDPRGRRVASGNPYRLGGTVLICEDPTRPELNWHGTVLSTAGGMLTVRDLAAPFASVDLERMYAFPVGTNLGW